MESTLTLWWLTALVLVLTTLNLGTLVYHWLRIRSPVELDLRRLNIVQEDGTPALVIANAERLPGVLMNGVERPTEGRGHGMIFFNSEGDENGGLTFRSNQTADGVSAGGHLSFDRFKSDQVIAMGYDEDPETWFAGFRVSEFPLRGTEAYFQAQDTIRSTVREDAVKGALDDLRRRWQEEGRWEKPRAFVGRHEGDALMMLSDAEGRPRIRIRVEASGHAAIQFLNENGTVERSIEPSL